MNMPLENPEKIANLWTSEEIRIKQKSHPPEVPPLPSHPAGRYTDEEFFRLEREHMFNKVWLLAGVADELPKRGSFKAMKLNGSPIVLVRGEDDKIRAFHDACQHRGASLVRQEKGTITSFVCPYHAWNFSLDGQLKFVPDEYDFPELDRCSKSLRKLGCEGFGNLIFVCFDSEAPPLKEYLGGLVDMLGDIPWDGVRLYKTCEITVNFNWKCVHDAFSETYHVQYTHPNTVHQAINRTYTARQMLRHGHNAMIVKNRLAEDGGMRQNVLDAAPATGESILNDLTRVAQRSYNIFPNLTVPVGENLTTILSPWPISVDKTLIQVRYLKIDASAEMDTEADRATFEGFNAVLKEDIHALEGIQESLAGGGLDYVTLGAGERFIYNFHRELDRVIGKENIPEHLRVTDIDLPLVD